MFILIVRLITVELLNVQCPSCDVNIQQQNKGTQDGHIIVGKEEKRDYCDRGNQDLESALVAPLERSCVKVLCRYKHGHNYRHDQERINTDEVEDLTHCVDVFLVSNAFLVK